ncbi:hypothetical protein [Brevibacillus dissolubilis]|nr:hypothetical protein [Brevibacillus dissolubilis]
MMKKNAIVGLLAIAAFLVPTTVTPTTFAASEKTIKTEATGWRRLLLLK